MIIMDFLYIISDITRIDLRNFLGRISSEMFPPPTYYFNNRLFALDFKKCWFFRFFEGNLTALDIELKQAS
jgi:hypothetical protein